MEQNKKLSLKEEMEKEARKIEQDVVDNPNLEDVKVSDEMEDALLTGIQSYEKNRVIECSKENGMGENTTEEFAAERVPDMPNFSERTNDGNVVHLSEEDLEALRLGRELLKKKNEDGELSEVNTDYHKHLNGGKTKVHRMPRKRKAIVALVAVCVLVVGTGVTSVGSKSYLKVLWDKIHGGQAMKITNVDDMDSKESEDGDEVTAYREIREKLGFVPVRIGYKPENMEFDSSKIDTEQRRAFVFYKYGDELIRYSVYENELDSSLGQKEEDILEETFLVETEEQNVEIKRYKVENYDDSRYIVDFSYKGIHYQLKGIMEKESIRSIVKNLIYFNKSS